MRYLGIATERSADAKTSSSSWPRMVSLEWSMGWDPSCVREPWSADGLLRRRLVRDGLLERRQQIGAVGRDDRCVVRDDLGVQRHAPRVARVAEEREPVQMEQLPGV